jgi:hypothetical protein
MVSRYQNASGAISSDVQPLGLQLSNGRWTRRGDQHQVPFYPGLDLRRIERDLPSSGSTAGLTWRPIRDDLWMVPLRISTLWVARPAPGLSSTIFISKYDYRRLSAYRP